MLHLTKQLISQSKESRVILLDCLQKTNCFTNDNFIAKANKSSKGENPFIKKEKL